VQANSICDVCNSETRASKSACAIGITEDAISQCESIALCPLCDVSMDESREIQFELVPVAFSVWTLHFAKFALETLIHDCRGFRVRKSSHIAAMLIVDERKETWKTVAVFEAQPTAVTDFERSLDFFV
jgi:hypothetical protein